MGKGPEENMSPDHTYCT